MPKVSRRAQKFTDVTVPSTAIVQINAINDLPSDIGLQSPGNSS